MFDLRLFVEVSVDQAAFQRLATWFSNRASALNGQRDTLAWFPLIQRLHQIRNPRPRRRTMVQQFMLDHVDVINTSFLHRFSDSKDLSNAQKMNARHDLARSLLAGQYSHLIGELTQKATDQHDAEVNEWSLTLDDISSAEDITRFVFSSSLSPTFVDLFLHSQNL